MCGTGDSGITTYRVLMFENKVTKRDDKRQKIK